MEKVHTALPRSWGTPMVRFLGRRVGRAVVCLFGVVTIVFIIVRIKGNPARLLLGTQATPQAVASLNKALGLDQSIPTQFWRFLSSVVHGSFGNSITYGSSAATLVWSRLGSTAVLATSAFVFGVLLAFVLALFAHLWGGERMRSALLWVGAVVQSVPTFLLGVLLILAFAIGLRVLPAVGDSGFRSLILPAVTLGSYEVTLYIRLLLLSLAEEEDRDYIRTAYAKGCSRPTVVLRHALPNALLPIVTVAGLNLGQLIGGTVVVETVFNWPGAGQLIYQGVSQQDYPIVQAGVIVIAAIFLLLNILVDALYAWIDPRVRLG